MAQADVKVTDTELGAFTFCRADEVARALGHWFDVTPDIGAVIEELQRKLIAGEPTQEEEAFLAVRIETAPGPEEDHDMTGG